MPTFDAPGGYSRVAGYLANVALAITCCLIAYLFFVCFRLAAEKLFTEMAVVALVAVLSLAVLASCGAVAIQFARGGDPVELAKQIGELASAFFQSSAFYYLSGLAFLVAAFICQKHGIFSTLTFLLALLGVAILLYGTGSQAMLSMGQGAGPQQLDPQRVEAILRDKLKDPEKIGEIARDVVAVAGRPAGQYANFAVAGGAAALTAFFGWAITAKSPEIRAVFQDHTRYVLATVEPSLGDLSLFRVTAHVEKGRDMYVRTGDNAVYIQIPEQLYEASPIIRVDLTKIELDPIIASFSDKNYRREFGFEIRLADKSETCVRSPRDDGEARLMRWASSEVPNSRWKCKADVKAFTGKNLSIIDEHAQVPTKTLTIN
jgi:hypothetical protein